MIQQIWFHGESVVFGAGGQVFNWLNPLSDGLLGNHEEPLMKFNLSAKKESSSRANRFLS